MLLLALAMPSSDVLAAPAAPATARDVHPFAASVTEASQRFAIPEQWIWRVMHAESRGNRRAVSRAGAMGLMQIMPGTWTMLTARHRLGSDPFDVRANILAGAAYLRAMWDRYRDIRLMLAAYNAGPGRVDAYAAGRRGLPAETTAYVAQIMPGLGADGAPTAVPVRSRSLPDWRSASIFAPPSERVSLDAEPDAAMRTGTALPASPTEDQREISLIFFPQRGRGE